MSDDGFYGDDDYDEYDDLIWNDDGEMILADDLAEHTLPSPVHLADPHQGLSSPSSDWDYYSDDYYDDDPVLLRESAEGEATRKSGAVGERRKSKKRKLDNEKPPTDDARNVPRSLSRWMKGTVWKPTQNAPAADPLYKPGREKRVALLDDWREHFKGANTIEFKKNPRSSSRPSSSAAAESDLEMSQDLESPFSVNDHSAEANGTAQDLYASPSMERFDRSRPKRRRVSSLESTTMVEESRLSTDERPEIETSPAPASAVPRVALPKSKKRKAGSMETKGAPSESAPRAKRAASAKNSIKAKGREKPPPLPTTRKTRSRDK